MTRLDPLHFLFCGLLLFALLELDTQAVGHWPQGTKAGGVAVVRRKTNVCALLTGAEVEAVQGDEVKETKPHVRSSDGILLSECLFRTQTAAKSVSLALATPNEAGPSALTPRRFWQEQFHPHDRERAEMPAEGQANGAGLAGENEGSAPRPIKGLGEEAYWVGNPVTGALYVLQGDSFLRVSVGGVPYESARIEKSKALARVAVMRL